MDDDLPYIPGHLLVKLPELSDRGAVAFVDFVQDFADDIASHYYAQIHRFHSNEIHGPDDPVQPGDFGTDSDIPF